MQILLSCFQHPATMYVHHIVKTVSFTVVVTVMATMMVVMHIWHFCFTKVPIRAMQYQLPLVVIECHWHPLVHIIFVNTVRVLTLAYSLFDICVNELITNTLFIAIIVVPAYRFTIKFVVNFVMYFEQCVRQMLIKVNMYLSHHIAITFHNITTVLSEDNDVFAANHKRHQLYNFV